MVMERWWDAWEERTLPDHAEVAALYEIWGRTGGRLKKWNKDTGWRPPPPKHEGNAAPVETDEIHRLYGGNLQYKPAHGVMWRRGRLAKVELTENGLEGTLPPQLSVLKECRVIALFGNNLTGTLQNLELSRTLTHLDLSRNKLEGTIPPSLLCSLPKLRRLHLEANKFSGELPSQLSTLSDMEEFTAQNNLLAGPIPPALASLGRLRLLRLHGNEGITGPLDIPSFVDKLGAANFTYPGHLCPPQPPKLKATAKSS